MEDEGKVKGGESRVSRARRGFKSGAWGRTLSELRAVVLLLVPPCCHVRILAV